jgi:aminopeptidase
MVWKDVDLTVKVWSDRQRLWGSGRNIPSFELFVSPDWRGTNWWIRFSEPLYRYGRLIKGIELHFKDGIITKANATKWEDILLDMIAVENANKIGEFSLTDKRLSRITRFMADTLYDENVWWQYGNTHIAVGRAFKDSYTGDLSLPTSAERAEMGFNESAIHTDIVSTVDRTVTATIEDGTELIIYRDGEFVL